MRELTRDSHNAGEKPWDAQSQKEAVLDTLTGGLTRERRMRRVMMYYKRLDRERLDHLDNSYFGETNEVSPRELPDLTSGDEVKKLALVGLEVARSARAVQLEVHQTCITTATRASDRSLLVSGGFNGGHNLHHPTMYRVDAVTGKDMFVEKTGTLVVLAAANRSTVDIEGAGIIANEHYKDRDYPKPTGRTATMTFMIQGLPMQTAETLVGSLRQNPAETLDSVMYTTFADLGDRMPGRSLLQVPQPDQPESNLFSPDKCQELTIVPVSAW